MSTSLLAIPGVALRGVKKSGANLLRLKVVEGVDEKRKDLPSPFVASAIFPNCFAAVLRGFGGLSVPSRGPRTCHFEQVGETHFSLWESRMGCSLRRRSRMILLCFWGLSIQNPWATPRSGPRHQLAPTPGTAKSCYFIHYWPSLLWIRGGLSARDGMHEEQRGEIAAAQRTNVISRPGCGCTAVSRLGGPFVFSLDTPKIFIPTVNFASETNPNPGLETGIRATLHTRNSPL